MSYGREMKGQGGVRKKNYETIGERGKFVSSLQDFFFFFSRLAAYCSFRLQCRYDNIPFKAVFRDRHTLYGPYSGLNSVITNYDSQFVIITPNLL